jgi:hypothetical protein
MVETWEGVAEATMVETHKARLLVGLDAHIGSETSVGTLQARLNH